MPNCSLPWYEPIVYTLDHDVTSLGIIPPVVLRVWVDVWPGQLDSLLLLLHEWEMEEYVPTSVLFRGSSVYVCFGFLPHNYAVRLLLLLANPILGRWQLQPGSFALPE